jgi:hypothetical protein
MSSIGDDADARVALSELLRVAGRIQDSLRDVGTGLFELGTVIDWFREGRIMAPSATHTPQTIPWVAPPPAAPPSAAETEVKEPTPPSTATGSVAANFLWPDGCMVFEVPWEQVRDGVVHFGWMFACNNTKKLCGGARRRYYYCLGVFTCPSCNFVARPHRPLKVKIGAAAKLPRHVCPRHCGFRATAARERASSFSTLRPPEQSKLCIQVSTTTRTLPPASPHPLPVAYWQILPRPTPGRVPQKLRMGVDGRPSLADVDDKPN